MGMPKNIVPQAKAAPSASAFIRKHLKKSPAEITALAEKQGIKFSKNLVYVVRSSEGVAGKRKSRKPARSKQLARSSPRVKKTSKPSFTPKERAWLKEAVFTFGLHRADEIISEFRARLEV
jgi:hypothetical protein